MRAKENGLTYQVREINQSHSNHHDLTGQGGTWILVFFPSTESTRCSGRTWTMATPPLGRVTFIVHTSLVLS